MAGRRAGENAYLSARAILLAFIALALTPPAPAQEQPAREPVTLDTIQVVATRTPQAAAEVPASVSVVQGADGRSDNLEASLSEKLAGVPGILARDRQNDAQDEQLAIRGFGARSTFGIRGVRLYVDGIPATMPDGQGQVSSFDLASSGRIEILRGPFSALYGNSSGGVVQVFSADGAQPAQQRLEFTAGGFATRTANVDARGADGALRYAVDATGFRTGGFHDHSAAERTTSNAKIDLAIDDRTEMHLLLNAVSIPQALDPLGLTRAELLADPRQAGDGAIAFDTRKSVRQEQAGAVFERALSDAQDVRLLGYHGDRAITQFLAIPVAAQASPLSGGGVVALASPFGGVDMRWSARGMLAGKPAELVAGMSYDVEAQHRLGFENFVGDELGVAGALRRDEQDRVSALDQYAQATWNAGGTWSLFAGLRHSAVRFVSDDRFVTLANPDDSGRLAASATTPVAGIDWRALAPLHAYVSYGAGFETPTFDELGYRPDGIGGLNLGLRPALSRNGELGLKLDLARLQLNAALFRADTRDEIAVDTSSGGRSTFQNVGHARRQGGELELNARLGGAWRARLAYTYLDARFRDAFLTCLATPCPVATTLVPAGTPLPGIPRTFASAAVAWGGDIGLQATLDAQYVGSVSVNNADTDRASGYAVFDAAIGYEFARTHGDVRLFFRIDNLLDRDYVGSVIVNESNQRYFEPAPGRTFMVGLTLRGRERP